MSQCCCMSPQEERVINKNVNRQGRERIYRILERNQFTLPHVDVERAKYFTESMRETEGELLTLRWAKALRNVAEKITVWITPDQLLAGRVGKLGRYGILYPEIDGDFYREVLADLEHRDKSPFQISKEDIRTVMEDIAPYWEGKTYHEHLNRVLPADIRTVTYHDERGLKSKFVVSETSSYRSALQWVPDYEKVITRGMLAIQQDARDRMATLDLNNSVDLWEKKPFLEAMIIVCDAIMIWARRHADLARDMAAREEDPRRKQELLEIAEICDRVPALPARTFREAVQSQWFVQMFSRLEQKASAIISNGRMDQQLISFYRQDMANGTLTEEKALEILGCLWCQMAQFIELPLSPGVMDTQAGFAHWEAVTIGGQTRDGQDATNELTYLMLRSKREFPTHYPDLAARVHTRSPRRYLWDIAETIKQGQGYPKVVNDEELIPRLLAKGAPVSDVYDYVVSGCNETRLINRETYMSPGTQVNLCAALELTLRNGRLRKFGDEVFTFESGDPLSFATWEVFFKAYEAQLHHLIVGAFLLQDTIHHTRARYFASPLASGLHDLCMESCLDLNSDQSPEGAFDLAFFDAIGFGTLVDSLLVIKKLVYEDKSVLMSELLTALDDDFEHNVPLQAILARAPRFGNGDDYADNLYKQVEKSILDFTARYARKNGVQPIEVRTTSVTANVPHGKFVSAMPNGRKAWQPLSDGSSPSHGSDVSGPTAVLLSQYKSTNWNAPNRACRLLNMKLAPKTVEGDEGTQKLVDLLRSFIDLRVWHLQMNVINRETMIAAQKDPHKYRNLVVRIAGYSAYFVDLNTDLQNDLIDRTEQASC